MKTQKLQFALTSLHNSQTKSTSNDINKKTPSNSDNKSKQNNTNVDI